MKAQLLMLSAAGLLMASAAHAAPASPTERFVDAAEATAAARLSEAGVPVSAGLAVRVTVNADRRLTNVRVVRSSGSLETDAKAEVALRRLKVDLPPTELVGRQVTLALGEPTAGPPSAQP
jgi:TonB family protein